SSARLAVPRSNICLPTSSCSSQPEVRASATPRNGAMYSSPARWPMSSALSQAERDRVASRSKGSDDGRTWEVTVTRGAGCSERVAIRAWQRCGSLDGVASAIGLDWQLRTTSATGMLDVPPVDMGVHYGP